MEWEILEGLDITGSDLEAIADKEMALSQCYVNPRCQGVVWSEAQGQAYLKSSTRERNSRKRGLQLSLFVRAYREYKGLTCVDTEVSNQVVTNPDSAKLICETTLQGQCAGFVMEKRSGGSHVAHFYSQIAPVSSSQGGGGEGGGEEGGGGKTTNNVAKAEKGVVLYRVVSPGDVGGISAAQLVGVKNLLPPVDISNEPPIIVGGTDGSGTRAVVTLLSNLNVLMVKDDACTFDVHAGEMGGWPPVVRQAIRYAQSANYNPEDIPSQARDYIRGSMQKFARKMKAEAKRFSSLKRHQRWGFKAPISQMLLPFLEEVFPGFSFVHVLRDGRDLPFSKNQSPVDKFYDALYRDAGSSVLNLPPKHKAIKMWSDANTQVLQYMESVQIPSKGSTYLPLKIEMSVEEESLLQIGYVCNQKLELGYKREDMCCRLRGYIRLLKQKDFFNGIKKRYGKWRQKTESNPGLRQALHLHGKNGLQKFKYLDEHGEDTTVVTPLHDVPSFRICDDVEEVETCEFDFPSKCIESPNIR